MGENMEIDDFKAFVRTIPSVKDDVVSGRYTWQQLYEFYVLYGENDKMWDPYTAQPAFSRAAAEPSAERQQIT